MSVTYRITKVGRRSILCGSEQPVTACRSLTFCLRVSRLAVGTSRRQDSDTVAVTTWVCQRRSSTTLQGGPKISTDFVRLKLLYEIFTDFLNYFTVRLRRKSVIILSHKILPHIKCVATLPCEISAFCRSSHWSVASPAWVRLPAARRTHWTFDVKLQDVTVTLDNNWDNEHVIFCCWFLKYVVTEVVFFSIVA